METVILLVVESLAMNLFIPLMAAVMAWILSFF